MNITEQLTPYNHDSGRAGHSITGVVLHTMVGNLQPSINLAFNPNRGMSMNYCVGLDGQIVRVVREGDTAYCNGNYQSNLTAISIEHEDAGDYNGARTPELYNASSELVADICKRYGIPCDREHIRGHNEVIDKRYYPGGTACPDSLDLNRIIAAANAILSPAEPVVAQPIPSATGETVLLPADNTSWNFYPTDKLPRVGNESAQLNPSLFGGLTYNILGHPYPNVVTIQSQNYGIGNIWVGSDTNAQISGAPAPAPISPSVPAAVEDKAPAIAKSTYTRLESPMDLVTNKQPTNVYNLDPASWGALNASVVKSLNKDSPFRAVGKATHPLGGVYFMTEYSFAQAETTGAPTHNWGVNTVDLSPAPAAAVETPDVVVAPPVEPPPLVVSETQIPVTVVPTDPNKWKAEIDKSYAGSYTALQSLHISSLTNPADQVQLVKSQPVAIAGAVKKDGILSLVTQKSIDNGTFYAIPPICLKELSLLEDIEMFGLNEAADLREEAGLNNLREKTIKRVASIDGFVNHVLHRNKK